MTSFLRRCFRSRMSRAEKAREWLKTLFRVSNAWPTEDIFRLAREQGFSRHVLFSPEVSDLPIRKLRKHHADGSVSWTWIWISDCVEGEA